MVWVHKYLKVFLFWWRHLKGFLSDLKTHIGHVPDWIFFDTWDMDKLFLSLAFTKKIIKFYMYINVIHVKNKNCEFLQNLCTDFLVVCQLKLLGCLLWNKENSSCRNLDTPSQSQVGSKNKPSISISSCHSNNIWVLKEFSNCSLML